MQANLFTKIFFVVLFLKVLIEGILEKRNHDYILKNRENVPAPFAERIALSDHQKAADYSVAKIKANQVFHLFDLIFGLFLLCYCL